VKLRFEDRSGIKYTLRKGSHIFKEEKENILFGGGDGSGRSETLRMMIYELLSEKQISNFLYFNFLGDNSAFYRTAETLEPFGLINEKNKLYIYNFLTRLNTNNTNTTQYFMTKKAIDNMKTDLSKKNSVFLLPPIEKYFIQSFFDILEALPKNTGKEIPIITDNISCFKLDDFINYSKLMKKVNNKGYFFINSIYGMFNLYSFEDSFNILKNDHSHILMANSQINIDNKYMKNIQLGKKLNHIEPGHFYYFKDLKLEYKYLNRFHFVKSDYNHTNKHFVVV
tara:strand:+ start:12701 stop:13546 length:846 start_codon:yes stop_codon:yes gene_type:complete